MTFYGTPSKMPQGSSGMSITASQYGAAVVDSKTRFSQMAHSTWRLIVKFRFLLSTLILGAAALSSSSTYAQAMDPCSVYTCMAGISGVGASGGPACAVPIQTFFSIVVMDPYFDAPATSAARQEYLATCKGSSDAGNAAILAAIISEWGTTP